MRIDIQRIIAVLSLAATWIWIPSTVAHSDLTFIGQKAIRKSNSRRDSKLSGWSAGGEGLEEERDRPWMNHREHMTLLMAEGGEEGNAVECCPSRLEMVEPDGGKNQEDMYVELYRDGENRQRFYEISCREDVYNKPCRFLDRKLFNQSRCVQKYSFSYALVLDTTAVSEGRHHIHHHHGRASFSSREWKMDYIKVRSGCSCEVTPKIRKRKNNARSKKTHRTRKLLIDDET